MESVKAEIDFISVKFTGKEFKKRTRLQQLDQKLQLNCKIALKRKNSEKCGHEEKNFDERKCYKTELMKLCLRMVEKVIIIIFILSKKFFK